MIKATKLLALATYLLWAYFSTREIYHKGWRRTWSWSSIIFIFTNIILSCVLLIYVIIAIITE